MERKEITWFTWNYYMYCLINLNNRKVVEENEDINYIRTMKDQYQKRNKNNKYIIQQVHTIARITK